MTDPATIAEVEATAEAAATVAAPLLGDWGALADTVLTQALAALADFQAKKAAGTLTPADIQTVAGKTGVDLAQLQADAAAQG